MQAEYHTSLTSHGAVYVTILLLIGALTGCSGATDDSGSQADGGASSSDAGAPLGDVVPGDVGAGVDAGPAAIGCDDLHVLGLSNNRQWVRLVDHKMARSGGGKASSQIQRHLLYQR